MATKPAVKKKPAAKKTATKKAPARKTAPGNPVHRQIEMLRKQLSREFQKLYKELKIRHAGEEKAGSPQSACQKGSCPQDGRPSSGAPDDAPSSVKIF